MHDDELRWPAIAREPGHDYGIFRSAFVRSRNPRTGTEKRFSLIECVDWVNVIALTPDDRVVLLRQYRPGVDRVCIEIPGGMVDAGEDPAAAAARELAEETGYVAPAWRRLGSVAPNPAFMSNTLHSFLALDAEPSGTLAPEPNEVLDIYTAPLADVAAMLRDGTIDHALVIDAFHHLLLAGGAALKRPA